MTTIFVRVLSEAQWFGAWTPIEAVQSVEDESIFILMDNDLTEDDEYEFFESGTEVRVEKRIDEQGNIFLGAVESINADTEHSSSIVG